MAEYVKPTDVTSPKDKWQLQEIIWDGGASSSAATQFALALGTYNGKSTLAMRWNGTDEDGAASKGTPLIATHPTWFFLPNMLDAGVLITMAVGQVVNKPSQLQSSALGTALQELVINKSELLQRFEVPIRKVIGKI